MIHDHIRHHINMHGKRFNAVPITQTGINLGVIDRIKACIGTIDCIKKRQQVNAAKNTREASDGARKAISELSDRARH